MISTTTGDDGNIEMIWEWLVARRHRDAEPPTGSAIKGDLGKVDLVSAEDDQADTLTTNTHSYRALKRVMTMAMGRPRDGTRR